MGFMFLFNSIALSYQEIVITIIEKPGGQAILKWLSIRIGIVLFILFQLVVWTPLADIWFRNVSD